MENLKYRIWNTTHSHWCNHLRLQNFGFTTDDEGNVDLWGEDYLINRCCGLKDSNGHEIFEGDIIECDSVFYQVYWCDDQLQYQAACKNDTLALSEFRDSCFIQGNIFEEPNLKIL